MEKKKIIKSHCYSLTTKETSNATENLVFIDMLEKYFNNSNYDSLSITALLLIIDEMQ